jgi:hypothetical protein
VLRHLDEMARIDKIEPDLAKAGVVTDILLDQKAAQAIDGQIIAFTDCLGHINRNV